MHPVGGFPFQVTLSRIPKIKLRVSLVLSMRTTDIHKVNKLTPDQEWPFSFYWFSWVAGSNFWILTPNTSSHCTAKRDFSGLFNLSDFGLFRFSSVNQIRSPKTCMLFFLLSFCLSTDTWYYPMPESQWKRVLLSWLCFRKSSTNYFIQTVSA